MKNYKVSVKEMFRYFCFSMIAWDDNNKLVEDKPENDIYFKSYSKKILTDDMNKIRNECKRIRYFENQSTSTAFNICEVKNGEVVFAFRGSDSAIDWIMDFTFFRQKIKNEIDEKLFKSKESFEKMCFEEYVKSCEGVVNPNANIFRNMKLVNPFRNMKLKSSLKNSDEDSKSTSITAELNKNKIYLHSGFVSQFNSVEDTVDSLLMQYLNMGVKRIVFTGHSLGSSICRIAALVSMLKHPEHFDKFYCYAYGTPKIGNKYLDYLFNAINSGKKRFFICNVKDDFVSKLPPNIYGYTTIENDLELVDKGIPPFDTKFNHTLFYYIYLFLNGKYVYK